MATEKLIGSDIAAASADLSTHQFKFVVVSAGPAIALAGSAGVQSFVLQDKPKSGQNGTYGTVGKTKVKYGGTIAAGAKLTTTAAGLALTATTGQTVNGIAAVDGVSGDVGSMWITSGGLA